MTTSCDFVNAFVRKRLRELRTQKGLTLRKIATLTGVPLSSYACMETGQYRIHLDFLHRVLRVLEADISEIWPAENEKSDQSGRPSNHH